MSDNSTTPTRQPAARRDLSQGFNNYFRIDRVEAGPLLDEVFHVRHEVYCEDLGFEPERPDRREVDPYDAHSVHCLLRGAAAPHTRVGCTRIVLTDPADPYAPLPFERSCAETLDRSIVDPAKLPRGSIAEISRLAVRAQFRRRKGEEHTAVAIQDEDFAAFGAQQRFPFIPTSLLLGAVALAEHNQVETIFVLTEPRLAAHFSHLGVEVRQIGAPISHRGTRVPSVMHIEEIIRNMRSLIRPLWEIVRQQIREGSGPT